MRPWVLTAILLSTATFICDPALAKTSKTDSSKYYDVRGAAVSPDVNDPWEGFNQPIFSFNLAFDKHIFKPFISAYDQIPSPVRHSFSNFLSNLSEPLNFIHGIFQLKPNVAFTSMWRFILNSTFGLGGLHDFAREEAGLRNMDQNLGKTLGYWGVGAGPYVVLPILGPSSVRDTTGRVGDWFGDPVGWEETIWLSLGQAAANGIDTRDQKAGLIDHLYYQSLDPYIATRSVYRQHEEFESKSKE